MLVDTLILCKFIVFLFLEQLHTPPVLPPHLKQRMRDLPQRADPHRLHQHLEQIAPPMDVAHGIDALSRRNRRRRRVRAAGENPEALEVAGRSVALYQWLALATEALLVGAGGAYLALALSSGFAENMVAGRGFIALAIVVFGRWTMRKPSPMASPLIFSSAAR